jgi:hypothetical protein
MNESRSSFFRVHTILHILRRNNQNIRLRTDSTCQDSFTKFYQNPAMIHSVDMKWGVFRCSLRSVLVIIFFFKKLNLVIWKKKVTPSLLKFMLKLAERLRSCYYHLSWKLSLWFQYRIHYGPFVRNLKFSCGTRTARLRCVRKTEYREATQETLVFVVTSRFRDNSYILPLE